MRLWLIVTVALVVTACAEPASQPVATSGTEAASPPTSAPSSTVVETTASPPSTSSSTETTRPPPNPDRMPAPDFSLTLSDGTEYQLANEVRPVYLVFWAEW